MNIAVILAAGSGTRIKHADKPKQFIEIGGKPILCHTVDRFLDCKQIDHIVIAVHKDWIPYTKALFTKGKNDRITVCEGGNNRQESLYLALIHCRNHLKAPDNAIILSHDAARPFLMQETINDNIQAMGSARVVTTAIPAVDTIIQSKDGLILSAATSRRQMYQAQTPQSFYLGQYIDLYHALSKKQIKQLTDISGLFHIHGIPVSLVAGNRKNLKITTDDDLQYAEYLLNKQ